jgi:hypothetical protein
MAVTNLVALKVIIKTDPVNGGALYPDFNLISNATRNGMDWSNYIDINGGGWHYDKTSGHQVDTADSPLGQQIGCLCVPQAFAAEALAMFPADVSELTEAEFELFHDDKAHAHEPDDKLDSDVLNGLNAQRQLMIATEKTAEDTSKIAVLDVRIAKALDPNDDSEMGVSKNVNRRWVDLKASQNLALKTPKKVVA